MSRLIGAVVTVSFTVASVAAAGWPFHGHRGYYAAPGGGAPVTFAPVVNLPQQVTLPFFSIVQPNTGGGGTTGSPFVQSSVVFTTSSVDSGIADAAAIAALRQEVAAARLQVAAARLQMAQSQPPLLPTPGATSPFVRSGAASSFTPAALAQQAADMHQAAAAQASAASETVAAAAKQANFQAALAELNSAHANFQAAAARGDAAGIQAASAVYAQAQGKVTASLP
jgi:hypothetical protein